MEHSADFRFYGELAPLVAAASEGERVLYPFNGQPAVKDAIEALGVPHTEVDVITANRRSVDFAYPLQANDSIEVFPFAWPVTCHPVIRLVPPPPKPLRFILDVHLGRLARRLRLLGLDSVYSNDFQDAEIARRAVAEQRILLTGDRGLLKRRIVRHGCLLVSGQLERQLAVLQKRYQLLDQVVPLGRCPACNGSLRKVDKADIADRLQPQTLRHHDDFRRCSGCGKIYWLGSHAEKILAWIRQLREGDAMAEQ